LGGVKGEKAHTMAYRPSEGFDKYEVQNRSLWVLNVLSEWERESREKKGGIGFSAPVVKEVGKSQV